MGYYLWRLRSGWSARRARRACPRLRTSSCARATNCRRRELRRATRAQSEVGTVFLMTSRASPVSSGHGSPVSSWRVLYANFARMDAGA